MHIYEFITLLSVVGQTVELSGLYRIDWFLILEKVNSFHMYNTGEAHKNESILKFTL